MGMAPTDLAAHYREYAVKCVAVAQSLEGAAEKLTLLDMAKAWMTLAEQSEKSEGMVLVYETPITNGSA